METALPETYETTMVQLSFAQELTLGQILDLAVRYEDAALVINEACQLFGWSYFRDLMPHNFPAKARSPHHPEEDYLPVSFQTALNSSSHSIIAIDLEPAMWNFWMNFRGYKRLTAGSVVYVAFNYYQMNQTMPTGIAFCIPDTPTFRERDEVLSRAQEIFGITAKTT